MSSRKRKVEDTTEKPESKKQEIHPFFKPKVHVIRWTDDGSLLYGEAFTPVPKARIAAFDLDGTIFTVRGKHIHAKHADDWRFIYDEIPKQLSQLHEDGFKIVFFSNQNGIRDKKAGTTNPKKQVFKDKLERVVQQLNIPVQIFAAQQRDIYRKPLTGMWDAFVEKYNDDVAIDLAHSFYVGDAAGREDGWAKDKVRDFSDCDRKFATNIGLTFYTPEEYFMKEQPAPFTWQGIHPEKLLATKYDDLRKSFAEWVKGREETEMVVFTGRPASGKSTFYRRWFAPAGYVHVNQDTLRTKERCLAVCKKALEQGQSVVIDNTNPDAATRRVYTQLARQLSVPVRCFYFIADEALARHNDAYRALTKKTTTSPLPDVAFHMFNAKFTVPDAEAEDFDEIKHVPFVPEFEDDATRKAWLRWHV